jgi:hypothetical protein
MGLRRVDLHALLLPQEAPLSHYQRREKVEWLLEVLELDGISEWLSERGIDTKVEMFKIVINKERYIRCVVYADMAEEDAIMLRLAFNL